MKHNPGALATVYSELKNIMGLTNTKVVLHYLVLMFLFTDTQLTDGSHKKKSENIYLLLIPNILS